MSNPDASYMVQGPDGSIQAYVGPDATNAVRAMVLASSLGLWAKTKIIPTRGVTITKMLAMATGYTGKAYKRTQAQQAADDVRQWAREMKAALPVQQAGQ